MMRFRIGSSAYLLLFLVFGMTTTRAQFIRGYGIKVGAVTATQNYDYNIAFEFSPERRWGLDLGGFIEVLDIPYISVLGELHYIQKGFSEEFQETSADEPDGTGRYISFEPRADYLSVPILAKLRFELGPVVPYIVGGPRFDILIGRDTEGFAAIFDELKSTDAGYTVGAGIEIGLPSGPSILGEIRYSPDITDAFKNSTVTVRNESVELLVGIMF